MSRPVYSTQLFEHASLSGGPFTEFVVEPGTICVVKCIVITWGVVTISGVDAWVQTDNLTKLWRYTWFTGLSDPTNNGGSSRFWGMHVLDPGQQLQTQAASGTVDITASGYILTLP